MRAQLAFEVDGLAHRAAETVEDGAQVATAHAVRHHECGTDSVEHRVCQLLTGAPDALFETAHPDLTGQVAEGRPQDFRAVPGQREDGFLDTHARPDSRPQSIHRVGEGELHGLAPAFVTRVEVPAGEQKADRECRGADRRPSQRELHEQRQGGTGEDAEDDELPRRDLGHTIAPEVRLQPRREHRGAGSLRGCPALRGRHEDEQHARSEGQ